MIIKYVWLPLLWSVGVLVLSLLPGKELPEVDIFQVDKLVHFFFFSVLMILSSYGLHRAKVKQGIVSNPILTSCVYSLSLGIGIEILQKFVPGRTFSFADMLANSIGVAIGYFIFLFIKRQKSIP